MREIDYIKALFLALLIFTAIKAMGVARAEDYPVSIQWTFEPANASGFDETALFPDRNAACDAARIYTEQTRGYTIPTFAYIDPESDNTPRCTGNKIAPEPQAPQFYIGEGHRQYLCLGGGTYNPTTQLCTGAPPCPEGQTRGADGACTTPPPPACEQGCNGACGQGFITQGPTPLCINSCMYNPGPIDVCLASGTCHTVVGTNTGNSCTASPPESDPAPPNCPECDCVKQGKTWGTVNGVVVCTKPGTPGTPPVTTNTPNPVETNTPAPTPENPDPEPETTGGGNTQTTITPGGGGAGGVPGGEPQVTETTTNPDGSSTTVTAPMSQYCEANPNAKICKGEEMQNFCDDNPDVLMCVELETVPEPEPIPEHEIDIPLLDLKPLPISKTCPAPISFTIGMQPITISYDWLCQYAEAFNPLVVASAWISALFIAFGVGRRE